MPFGCFGKRKKNKDKCNSPSAEPERANNAAGSEPATKPQEPQEVKEEVVTVARTQSLLAAATPNAAQQNAAGIQKSATLARYDFLKKSDYANSADRWAALKQQYLVPKMTQSQHSDSGQSAKPLRVAQSLPRQFAPPSTVVSVVKFSHWFYERQIKEEEARQEANEREDKARTLRESFTLPAVPEAAPRSPQPGDEAEDPKQEIPAQEPQQEQEPQQTQREQDQQETQPQQTQPQQDQQETQQQQEPQSEAGTDQEQQQSEESEAAAGNSDEVAAIDLQDPELADAAMKIQAGFKAMQARKEIKQMQQENDQHQEEAGDHPDDAEQLKSSHDGAEQLKSSHADAEQLKSSPEAGAENGEASPSESEMNTAAAKIQAGFKGYKTRKDLHQQQREAGEMNANGDS